MNATNRKVVIGRDWITPLLMLTFSPSAMAQSLAAGEGYRFGALVVFALLVLVGLVVATAARRWVRAPVDFYASRGAASALPGGFALAGDYLSAASFLGVAGMVALWGFDGILYALGWLVAYLSVILLLAEPCRNLGVFTPSDLLASRIDPRAARLAGAAVSIVLALFYLTAQMLAGGMLLRLMTGIDYEVSVLAVGALVLIYVLLGGVAAAVWLQVIKGALLLVIAAVLAFGASLHYDGVADFLLRLGDDPSIRLRVVSLLGEEAGQLTPGELGARFMAPGLLHIHWSELLSLSIALVFGGIGLPHILMRFFTVADAVAARRSLGWSVLIVALFYLLAVFLGLEAAMRVGVDTMLRQDPGGNLALPALAQALYGGSRSIGGNLALAVVVATAFVMIVAVTASLVRTAASALARDLFALWRPARFSDPRQLGSLERWAMLVVGLFAGGLGISAQGLNVAELVALAFALAAVTFFPAITLCLHWRLATTRGILAGMLAGALAALTVILVSPLMTYPSQVKAEARKTIAEAERHRAFIAEGLGNPDRETQERARQDAARLDRSLRQARFDLVRFRHEEHSLVGLTEPLIALRNPALIALPLAFLVAIGVSLLSVDRRARERWTELQVRQYLGTPVSLGVLDPDLEADLRARERARHAENGGDGEDDREVDGLDGENA